MSRMPLTELRHYVFDVLDDQWVSATDVAETLGVGHGFHWYRVSLVLERLANDGVAEIEIRGNRRRFRQAPA